MTCFRLVSPLKLRKGFHPQGLQPRFRDILLTVSMVCRQNGTAVLKGLKRFGRFKQRRVLHFELKVCVIFQRVIHSIDRMKRIPCLPPTPLISLTMHNVCASLLSLERDPSF